MPDLATPKLTVSGTEWTGWTSLEADCAIDRMAGAFELCVTQGDPAKADLLTIQPGDRCALLLGTETIMTGWVDAVSPSIDDRRHEVRVRGRDATCDLVDCAAEKRPYSGRGLLEIAQEACAPFGGITVSANADLGAPFGKVVVEPGEKVFDLLERLARQRAVLLMTDGAGGLIVGRPGLEPAPCDLVLGPGGNLKSLEVEDDWTDRYSEYRIQGQSAGTDEFNGEEAAAGEGRAEDPEVGRSRKRVLIQSAEEGQTDLTARAQWEQRVRAGRSRTATAVVQGWSAAPGRVWRAGWKVTVKAPYPGFKTSEELLIVSVHYSLNDGGTVTRLTLTAPGAFEPELAYPDPKDDEA